MKHNKIDVVVKYFVPVAAGIETNILETYSILAQKGWDITIHTSQNTLTEKDCLPAQDTIRGLKIKRYPFRTFGYWPHIDFKNTDLVCLHNFDIFPHVRILFYTLILKLQAKKSFGLILTPHGGYTPEWSIFSPLKRYIKQLYHRTLGALLINAVVDYMRAVSTWELQEIIGYGIRKKIVGLISNGIEDDAYANLEAEASKEIKHVVKQLGTYIIQIGRIYVIKNYETAIRALIHIPSHVKYVIAGPVGDDTYKQKLTNLIKELHLEDRVIFLGVIRGIDKYYLIRHAQMMVHMAIWESFCNVVHEGLSQGLICIVANNTALPLLIRDGVNGYCIDTYDVDGVAKKINYVLKHKNTPELIAMAERNRKFGLETSWTSVAEKMHKVYITISHKKLC